MRGESCENHCFILVSWEYTEELGKKNLKMLLFPHVTINLPKVPFLTPLWIIVMRGYKTIQFCDPLSQPNKCKNKKSKNKTIF